VLISDSHRALFVHVQKTGGSSIDKMLREHLDDARSVSVRHSTLGQILRREPSAADYWVFGFVRNPWVRMVSWWAMIEKWNKFNGPESGKDLSGRKINSFWVAADSYRDFDDFIMRGPEEHRRLRTPQINYLTTKHRRADFIGRTETFNADMRAVLARLDLPQIEPIKHNTSQHGTHETVYTDVTRKRIADIFARDIDLFGYKF
jgi:hypothetical protein